jgi:hypothetical protein
MVSGAFVDFQTTIMEWPEYSKELWAVFEGWNNKWEEKPSVDNLMAMVVSERKVTGKRLLLARVLADPKALMDSNYVDATAINTGISTGVPADNSFPMDYSDLGNNFYLSALKSK